MPSLYKLKNQYLENSLKNKKRYVLRNNTHKIFIKTNTYCYFIFNQNNILVLQRWKNRGTRGTLIFSSCANFLDFTQFLAKFCVFLHIFLVFMRILHIFVRLCVFLHAFFVPIFQAQKLCQCYLSRFLQLW